MREGSNLPVTESAIIVLSIVAEEQLYSQKGGKAVAITDAKCR